MRRVGAAYVRPRIAQVLLLLILATSSFASLGDRLPDFRECVKVQGLQIPALTGLLTTSDLYRGELRL